MTRRTLFLLGGSDAFDVTFDEFVPLAGGRDAEIALLMQGGSNWEKYVPGYTAGWMNRGARRFCPVVPDENGWLDGERAVEILYQATGIVIGGGHTPTYQQLYAIDPVRNAIRARYEAGVPIAGVSAGALIAVRDCVLDGDETGSTRTAVVPGLDLVDLVLQPHFTGSDRLPVLLESLAVSGKDTGWGIDDSACMVFENKVLARVLGEAVYRVTLESTSGMHMIEKVA